MKPNITRTIIALSVIIFSVALLSSCSTSNQLGSQHPNYHFNLVKTDKHSTPPDNKINNDITPGFITAYPNTPAISNPQVSQINDVTRLLLSNVRAITKQQKKSDPQLYKQLKSVHIPKTVHQLVNYSSMNNKSSVNKTDNMDSGHYLVWWIVFLLISILFSILSFGAPILYIFAVLAFVAAVIFFILWIVSLATT